MTSSMKVINRDSGQESESNRELVARLMSDLAGKWLKLSQEETIDHIILE